MKKKKSEDRERFSLLLDANFLRMMQMYSVLTKKRLGDLFAEALYKRYRKEVEQISSLPFVKSALGSDALPQFEDMHEEAAD